MRSVTLLFIICCSRLSVVNQKIQGVNVDPARRATIEDQLVNDNLALNDYDFPRNLELAE